ncbi:glycosyltransferase [Roseobacteraceae bacterium S113]
MSKQTVVHLIDDATAGGVMRAVGYLTNHPELCQTASHDIVVCKKGALTAKCHDADVIVSHLTLNWRGLPGLIGLLAKNPKARLVHVEHSYTRAFTALNVRHRKRFMTMLRLSYAIFDRIVAVSRDQARWIDARGLAGADKLQVICPLVNVAPFEAVQDCSAHDKTIGAIGRLEPQKGFDILIDGFRRWDDPEARLIIFGEGSERAKLEAQAKGDARIDFRGFIDDPARALASVSVVAIPSRWEAYGLVCLEAQSAGRTVLAADVDGLSDDDRGMIHKPGDNTPRGWAALLQRAPELPKIKGAALRDAMHAREERWVQSWSRLIGA